MKVQRTKQIAVVLATALSALALSGCGSSTPAAAAVVPGVGAVAPGAYGVGSCVPLTAGTIPFTGTGIQMNWNTIAGGIIPGSQAYGQMYVGGGAAGGQFGRTDGEGTISLNVTPTNGYPTTGYPTGGTGQISTASVTGSLQLSQATIQTIQQLVASNPAQYGGVGGVGYPPVYGQPGYGQPGYGVPGYGTTGTICVSGIAMMLNYSQNTNQQLYGPFQEVLSGSFQGAGVYLYLNNTQHGYQLQF